MSKRFFAMTLAASLLAVTCLSRADEGSTVVKLDDLPPAVRKGVQKEVAKGKIDSIEKVTEDGEVTYDVEMTKQGRTRSFTLDDAGKMIELEVFPRETPPAVHATITQQVGKGTIEGITKVFDGGVSFEVEMTAEGKSRVFTVGKDGTLLDLQVFLTETPAAVQKAIRTEVGSGKLGDITKVTEESPVTYEVEITRSGKVHVVTIAEDGTVNDRQVFPAELSAEAQKNIQSLAGTGKLGEIHQATEDGKTIYEVEIISSEGVAHHTTVDASGKTLYQEDDIELTDAPAAVQAAIKELMGDGELLGLSRTTEDGDVSYDVDVKKAGKQQSFSLDADGKVLPDEN